MEATGFEVSSGLAMLLMQSPLLDSTMTVQGLSGILGACALLPNNPAYRGPCRFVFKKATKLPIIVTDQ